MNTCVTDKRRSSASAWRLALTAALTLCLLVGMAEATTSMWVRGDSDGAWTNAANWNNSIVPTNAGDVAILTNATVLTATRNITIDTPITLGALKFAVSNAASANAFNVNLGGSGSLTMDSGGAGNALVQQMPGSARCKVNANMVLNSELDIICSPTASAYFDVPCVISGNHGININPNGGTGQPYLNGANTFVGNVNVYGGALLMGNECFGSTSNGTRVVTIWSNNAVRVNYGSTPVTFATNRQIVSGTGGGSIDGNGKTVVFNGPNQLSGTNAFAVKSQNTVTSGLQLNNTNNGFASCMSVWQAQTLRLGTNGSINNAPVILLLAATSNAVLDVMQKTGGYAVPSNQVLAGVGTISGLVNVANANATIHPGTYWPPPALTNLPGVLTNSGGLAFANSGVYAWVLNKTNDDATATPGTTTFSQLNVVSGAVNLSGGVLAINFTGSVSNNTPASSNRFWKSSHTWTILTAAAPPIGSLAVSNDTYGAWTFKTQVNGNTLQLVYYSRGTAVMLR